MPAPRPGPPRAARGAARDASPSGGARPAPERPACACSWGPARLLGPRPSVIAACDGGLCLPSSRAPRLRACGAVSGRRRRSGGPTPAPRAFIDGAMSAPVPGRG